MDNTSFDMGLPGIALFYYYYYKLTNDNSYLQKVYQLIEISITKLSTISVNDFQNKYMSDSLDNHISGFGRLLLFLQTNLNNELDIEDLLKVLDDNLKPLMYSKIEIEDYDLDSGALASGYYFLERFKQTKLLKYRKYLQDLTCSIQNSSMEKDDGICWASPSLNNKIFLGLSHGSGMILNFLIKMIENNIISKSEISDNIVKGVVFITNNEREQPKGRFPHCYFSNEPEVSVETQFSQCYGDLGIGYAIFKAGFVLEDDQMYKKGLEILEVCSQRSKEDNLTEDASIVYGASGVACIFDEIYKITNNLIFEESSDYWFGTIPTYIEKSQANDIIFKSMFDFSDDVSWNTSFGWGIAGIGTTLIRFLDKKKYPSFNKLLMIGP